MCAIIVFVEHERDLVVVNAREKKVVEWLGYIFLSPFHSLWSRKVGTTIDQDRPVN